MKLNKNDYKKILNFYNLSIPKSERLLIKKSQDVLANKLCRCIKQVSIKGAQESKSVGICRNSVLKKKGVKARGFKCKDTPRFLTKKNKKNGETLYKGGKKKRTTKNRRAA